MSGMTISQRGIDELIGSEGLRLKAYQDQGKVWTIGYGHTGNIDGVPVGAGMTITKEKADNILRKKIKEFENAVNNNVKVPLSQNQFDALVSLAYNIGGGNFSRSSIPTYLNNGDYQKAADTILEFNKSKQNGQSRPTFNKGLHNRRVREREMFLNGEKIDAPLPENYYPQYDNLNIEPQKPTATPAELLKLFTRQPTELHSQPEKTQPTANLSDHFNQLNGTLAAFVPTEPIDYQQKYQKELAQAFGIEPSTKEMIPDYIGDLVRSIYDQA